MYNVYYSILYKTLHIPLSCHRRWQHYLRPLKDGYKTHDWTIDEVMIEDCNGDDDDDDIVDDDDDDNHKHDHDNDHGC